MKRRQHEPIRIPDRWTGQDRMLVLQINRLLDEIYLLIGKLEERVMKLEEQGEEEEET